MERLVNLPIERLPEGMYLATSEEIQGLIVQGRTLQKTLEIAHDVASKLLGGAIRTARRYSASESPLTIHWWSAAEWDGFPDSATGRSPAV